MEVNENMRKIMKPKENDSKLFFTRTGGRESSIREKFS